MVLDADFSIWEEGQEDLFKVIIHREFMDCLGTCYVRPYPWKNKDPTHYPGLASL